MTQPNNGPGFNPSGAPYNEDPNAYNGNPQNPYGNGQYGNNPYQSPQYPQGPYPQSNYQPNPYAPGYQQPYPNYQPNYEPSWNVLAIVGFVASFFASVVGLVCSIIGYMQTKKNGEKGNGLALAGIIISAVGLVGQIIAVIMMFTMGISLFDAALNDLQTSTTYAFLFL